eukprot:TRINITY_DN65456_c0_g1_i1.p1 TRINITY_DN65456_c0_g1~~TRINITY_DN65456_c0_g1_i1.p1  ORF type:complete len:447 (+),score=192.61 TRINITY_DN65456_c0_g1_i1:92-1342(+)
MAASEALAELEAFAGRAKEARVKELLAGYIADLKAEAPPPASAPAPAPAPAAHADPQAAAPPEAEKPQQRPRGVSKADKGPMQLQLDKIGDGMIDNMRGALDPEKVQFALVQFPIGSGSFQRNKMLMLEWAGSACPPMRRARHVQKKGEVGKLFGHTHAALTLSDPRECSIEHCLKELKGIFVSDSGQFSAAAMKAEIEKAIARAQRAEVGGSVRGRKTAKDMGIKEDAVLQELRKNLGKFNWCLLEPSPQKLQLYNAGSQSIDEMHDNLDEGKVLYGLVRLGFGKGEWRRTKWICVTFVGQSVGNIARGKQVGVKAEMERLLKPYSISIEVQGKEEATIAAILDRVRNFIVSDDLGKDDINEENFRQALAEETAENAEFFGDTEPAESSQSEEVLRAIQLVHAQGAPHWAVFSIA